MGERQGWERYIWVGRFNIIMIIYIILKNR